MGVVLALESPGITRELLGITGELLGITRELQVRLVRVTVIEKESASMDILSNHLEFSGIWKDSQ